MPRLSVVLPVYNVEKYLPACLESVRGQSVRDLEIICVDDGSTDRSRVILDMAAAVDDRVVVVGKPNGGLSSARNAGLKAATGDVVMFVDSDDYLHRRAVETVLAAFEETGAEIVTFGAWVTPASLTTPWLERTLSPRRVTYDGFDPDVLFVEASRPFVWRSAFTREFLTREALEFDESVKFGEDQVFAFASYPLSRRTALIPDKLYYYRVSRPDSLMASRFSDRATMMTEHHHITRVILDLWRDRGWLDTHRARMLEWVLEFLADEAVTAEGDYVPALRSSFADLLAEFFPAGAWTEALGPGAQALSNALRQGTGASQATLRAAHVAWRGGSDTPASLARRALGRLRRSAPVGRVRSLVARVLPGDGDQLRQLTDLRDQIADDAQRASALQLLYAEWMSAGGPTRPAG